MRRSRFLAASLGAWLSGCSSGPERHFDVLSPASEPLRSRFNAARSKVRVVMLLSPT